MNLQRAKPILLLVLVALVGFFCGVVTNRLTTRQTVRAVIQQPDLAWKRLENQLSRGLGLSEAQRGRAQEFLVDARREFAEVRAETRPRYAAILRRFQDRLATVLTPQQQERLERFRERRAALWQGLENQGRE